MRKSDKSVADLIEQIYEVALDDSRFAILLESLRREFDSDGAFYMLHDPNSIAGSMEAVVGVDPNMMEIYREVSADNPRIQRGAQKMEIGVVASGTDFVSDKELKRTRMYADFLRPLNVLPDMGAIIDASDNTAGFLVLGRSPLHGPYTASDRDRLGLLTRHMSRSLELRRRLHGTDRQQLLSEQLLQQAGHAVILLDASGRILFANEAAEEHLRRRSTFTRVNSRLEIVQPGARRQFSQLVRDALSPQLNSSKRVKLQIELAEPMSRQRYAVTVSSISLPRRILGGPIAAAAVFIDSSRPEPTNPIDQFCVMHALSPTEGRLVALLAEGRSMRACADILGQRINTTRFVLKRVFSKTECHSQGELLVKAFGRGSAS